jgi:hypothetical protein
LNSATNCFEENHNANDVLFDAEVSYLGSSSHTVEVVNKPANQVAELEALTVPEKVGGRKAELIERLEILDSEKGTYQATYTLLESVFLF